MASNKLPQGMDVLFTLAEDMADGLNAHQVTLGVAHNTETKVRADLLAGQTAQGIFLAARTAKTGLITAQTVADSNAKAFIGITRDVLAVTLGGQWSQVWEATGFPNQSLAVPTKMEERQALLAALQMYLVANPMQENAPLAVTAAQGGLRFTALSDARSAVNAGLTLIGQKKSLRDTAETTLRKRLRDVIDELAQLMPDDDSRWLAFGLVPPAGSDQPDLPENLVLTAGGPGVVLADWSDAARADHYRVYKQLVGIDPDFVLAASPADSDVSLIGLPSGQTVNVRVVSVNSQADTSPPSETKSLVIP